MSTSEALNSPGSPTLAQQQAENGAGAEAKDSSTGTGTGLGFQDAGGATKPRFLKFSDEFLMFKFKIEMCSRKDRHDWKICPYAHPGEVARRRHPRGYTAVLCPAKTAASCPRREQCTFAHNPFEFWLHPDRFKTSLCNQGPTCDRPICFFAHKDEEVRRLPNGLVPAGPDDYVYATASSPDPMGAAGDMHPPPPPPPPPRSLSQQLAAAAAAAAAGNAAALPFMAGTNPMLAAAAAAAAVAASAGNLGVSAGLLLNGSGTSPQQLMMLSSADESLLQAAGSAGGRHAGADAAAAAALSSGSWMTCNSDPSLLSSLTAAASRQHLSSPVPLRQASSSANNGYACSMPLGGLGMNGLPMSLDAVAVAAAAAAAAAGGSLDASHMLSMHSNGAGNGALSMACMGGMEAAGKDGMMGSAPAGYGSLQGEVAASLYQQQLLQQLQMVQQQQQLSQQQQQQLLTDQLALQQQLHNLQHLQQQARLPQGNSQQAGGFQQLLQQQYVTQQQQQQQQQLHQWKSLDMQHSGGLPPTQQLATSTPSSQLMWMQQQQQQRHLEAVALQQSASLHGSSLTPPADGALAATLGGQGNSRVVPSAASAPAFPGHSLSNSWQPYGAPAGVGGAAGGGGAPPGMIKWSSSILSKQRPNGSSGGAEGGPAAGPDSLTPPPALAGGGRSNSMVNMAGLGPDMSAAAAAATGAVAFASNSEQSSSRTASGDGSNAVQPLDQLSGLMQLCRVTSPGATLPVMLQ